MLDIRAWSRAVRTQSASATSERLLLRRMGFEPQLLEAVAPPAAEKAKPQKPAASSRAFGRGGMFGRTAKKENAGNKCAFPQRASSRPLPPKSRPLLLILPASRAGRESMLDERRFRNARTG